MPSTKLTARASGPLHRLAILLPFFLFVSIGYFGLTELSPGDVIVPGPHKVTRRLDGTLKGGPTEFWLETDNQKYRLIFNKPLEEVAKNLVDKRVVVRGYPMESRSGTVESDIEVASLLEAK